MRPGTLTTSELKTALSLADEGTDAWRELCAEAAFRVRAGSMSARHLPASYDPATYVLPRPG